MNHTFKVIFSKALGKHVVVSEHVKGQGKSSKAKIILASVIAFSGATAMAGPTGGVVAAGKAGIEQQLNLTTISQETSRAIINWNTFNVGKGEAVHFNLPNANAAILNRVASTAPSVIDGILKSNGNVFLLNQAGVMIGKDASINVGGLVASTLNIKDSDFMAGLNRLEGDSSAAVTNAGNINVSSGGLVALVGANVSNTGYIVAQEGSAFLAAAGGVTITLGEGAAAHSLVIDKPILDALIDAGGAVRVGSGQIILAAHAANGLLRKAINQTGVLEATSMTKQGGTITLNAGLDGRLDLTGTVSADGLTGGKITATGHNVLVSGSVSAKGEGNGGKVFIGGGYRGKDSNIQNAKNIAVTNSANVDVSSTDNGNGGTAIMFSTGSTAVTGDIKAKGGEHAGNGGLIETSGKTVSFNAKIDTTAQNGRDGEYLLDPDRIIISNDATSQPDDAMLPEVYGYTGTDETIVSKTALESISSGMIYLEADGYIRVKDLDANGGNGILLLKPNVTLSANAASTYLVGSRDGFNMGGSTASPIPGQTMGGIYFDNAANSIRTQGTGRIDLSAPGGMLHNIGNLRTAQGEIQLTGQYIDLKGGMSSGANIYINVDPTEAGQGFFALNSNVSTTGQRISITTGMSNTSGVTINGGINFTGNGELMLGSNLIMDTTPFDGQSPLYTINGTVSASGNLNITSPVQLGGTATIRAFDTLSAAGISIADNANVSIVGQKFDIGTKSATAGANSTVNIKAPMTSIPVLNLAKVTDGKYGIMEAVGPVTNMNIGTNTYQGKIYIAGDTRGVGKVSVLAQGTGGNVEAYYATNIEANEIDIRTDKDIRFVIDSGVTANKLTMLAGQDFDSHYASYFAASDIVLSVGRDFKSFKFGEALFPNTSKWLIYANDASKINAMNIGYSLASGFHRYGCTYIGGCTTGATIPTTGNGFVFKNAPTLKVIADNKTVTYGTANPLNGVGYSYSGFINGDTAVSAGLTGSGTVGYQTTPGTSSGGYQLAGTHNLAVNLGTIANTMGYIIESPIANGVLTVNKAPITVSGFTSNRVYNGTTSAATGITGTGELVNDNVAWMASTSSFSDKNVGTGKTVTSSVILGGLDGDNYYLTNPTITTTANITKKAFNASVSTANRVYDGTNIANTTVVQGTGKVAGDDVTAVITSSTYANKNASATTKTATTVLALTGADAGNYSQVASLNSSSIVSKKPVTLTSVNTSSKVYDGTTVANTTASIQGVIDGDSLSAFLTSSTFADKNVGNNKAVSSVFTLSGGDAPNYSLSGATQNTVASIIPKTLTTTVTTPNRGYNGDVQANSTFVLNGIVGADAVNVTRNSSVFTDKNAGDNKLVLNDYFIWGTDAANYILADGGKPNSYANITRAPISSQLFVHSKDYDGTRDAVVVPFVAGVTYGSDDINVSVSSALFDSKNVGVAKNVAINLGLTGADANNYVLDQTSVVRTADIDPRYIYASGVTTANKVYDGTTNANTSAVLDDVIAGDDVTLVNNGSHFDNKNAGTGKNVTTEFAITGADANNYAFYDTEVTSTADITKKAYNATVVTADREYDKTINANSSITNSDKVAGDDVTAVITSSTYADKNAVTSGTKTATTIVQLNGADAGNYWIPASYTTESVVSPKTASITNALSGSRIYNGTTTAYTVAGLLGVISGDAVQAVAQTSNFSDKNVGTGKTVTNVFGLAGGDASNYRLTAGDINLSTTANITQKTVTVGMWTDNKVYDGTTSANTTISMGGRVAGDDLSLVLDSATYSDKNVGQSKEVTNTYSLHGADAGNYRFASGGVATTYANITPKELIVGVNVQDKVYNGTRNAAADAFFSGGIAGDDIGIAVTSALFDTKNVGANKAVISNLALTGVDAANYQMPVNTLMGFANITPKVLTANLVTSNKVYDGTTNASTSGSLNDVVAGDDVVLTTSNSTFSDKNAGTSKSVTSTVSMSGADSANYTLTSNTATSTADIAKKTVTATVLGTLSKEYDGTTGTLAFVTPSGFISSDDVGIMYDSNFSDKNAALSKTVTTTVTIAGADASNYNLANDTLTSVASIDKKVISAVNVNTANKVYDATDTAVTTAQLSDKVVGDDIALVASTSNFADKNAGMNKVVTTSLTLSGNDAANYELDSASVTSHANIDKKQVSVSGATALDKVYDGSVAAQVTGAMLDGTVLGDLVSVNAEGTFIDKNAAVNKTVTIGYALAGADASNYNLAATQSLDTATINRKAIDVAITTSGPTEVTASGSPLSTSNLTANLVGAISGDNLTVGGIGYTKNNVAADGSTPGEYRAVVTSLSGGDAGNYEVNAQSAYSTANSVVITVKPAPVVVVPTPEPDPLPTPDDEVTIPTPEPTPTPDPTPPVVIPDPTPPVVTPEPTPVPPVVVPEPTPVPPVVTPEPTPTPPVVVIPEPTPVPPVVTPEPTPVPPVVTPEPTPVPPVVVTPEPTPVPPVVTPEPTPVPPVIVVPEPTPVPPVVTPEKPLPVVIRQSDNGFNPVYASGRVIETRGQVNTSTSESIDAHKGTQVVSAGTRNYNILDDMKVSAVKTEAINVPQANIKVEASVSTVDTSRPLTTATKVPETSVENNSKEKDNDSK